MQWISLFVYGSLRPGQCNYGELSAAVRQPVPPRVGGWLRLPPEDYPALTLAPGWPSESACPGHWWALDRAAPTANLAGDVEGELLELRWSHQLGQHLDAFEGFTEVAPDYLRVACWTSAGWAWTYVAPQDRPDWPQIAGWPPEQPIAPWVPHQWRQ